jgi:hypothetical protein
MRLELSDCLTARILDQFLGCAGSDIQRPRLQGLLRGSPIARRFFAPHWRRQAESAVAQRLACQGTPDLTYAIRMALMVVR